MPSGDSASVRMGFSSDGFTLKEKPRRNKLTKRECRKREREYRRRRKRRFESIAEAATARPSGKLCAVSTTSMRILLRSLDLYCNIIKYYQVVSQIISISVFRHLLLLSRALSTRFLYREITPFRFRSWGAPISRLFEVNSRCI